MKITVYTVSDCKFSQAEKEYLTSKNLPFEEKNLETNREYLTEMLSVSNNFAGTPVTKIVKDDGSIVVLKGFTQSEFDAALTGSPGAETVASPAPAETATAETAADAAQPSVAVMPTPDVSSTTDNLQPTTDNQSVSPADVQPAADMSQPQLNADQPVANAEPAVQTAEAAMSVPPAEPTTENTQPTMPAMPTPAESSAPAVPPMSGMNEPQAAPAPTADSPFQMPAAETPAAPAAPQEPVQPFQMPTPDMNGVAPQENNAPTTGQPQAPAQTPNDPLNSVMNNLQQKANS